MQSVITTVLNVMNASLARFDSFAAGKFFLSSLPNDPKLGQRFSNLLSEMWEEWVKKMEVVKIETLHEAVKASVADGRVELIPVDERTTLLRHLATSGIAFLMWESQKATTRDRLAFFLKDGRISDVFTVACLCKSCLDGSRKYLNRVVETCKNNGITSLFARHGWEVHTLSPSNYGIKFLDMYDRYFREKCFEKYPDEAVREAVRWMCCVQGGG
jgi:hypothetical protein